MIPRKISLYWASISLDITIHVLFRWILVFWQNPAVLREKLVYQISKSYCEGDWYMFGSARSGLSLFLKTLVNEGDEVIISSYTCLAVPSAVIAADAVPVYIDIEPNTLSINEAQLWSAVNKKTKAIVIQHTLGNPASIQKISRKANSLGLLVIEDCALSLGTLIEGRNVGTFGDASIFSMELSKTLSCGWGGLLLVNNTDLVPKISRSYISVPEQPILKSTCDLLQTIISTWCTHPKFFEFPGKYIMQLCWKIKLFRPSTPKEEFMGVTAKDFLHKMGKAQTLLATLQWRKSQTVTATCAKNYAMLVKNLRSLGYATHASQNKKIKGVANRVSFLANNRTEMMDFFRNKHIELGLWFDGPLSPVPIKKIFNYKAGTFPVAESIAEQVVNIPCHNRLSGDDIEIILSCLKEYTKLYNDSNNIKAVS